MSAFTRRGRLAGLCLAGGMVLGLPAGLAAPAHASGSQCQAGPVPILSNTNCQGDSGAAATGHSDSSSSSSSSSGSSNSGRQ